MAPKKMPKVTSLAGNGGGRSGAVDPSSYTDYDEAMEDGVELEEKGERFQFGSKAQRFYQQAGQLYLRAASLAPASGSHQAADALFNASRIQFLLGTQFYLPPQNVASIADSIYTSSQALHKLNLPPLPSGQINGGQSQQQLADPFLLDVVSARATAYQCLAELVDELGGWPSEQTRQRAGTSTHTAEDEDEADAASSLHTPIKLWKAAYEAFESVALAQYAILIDQNISVDSGEVASSSPPAEEGGDDDASPEEPASGNDVYGYTSSLVTTTSLIDSQLSSLACLTSLIQSARTVQSAQEWDARAQEALATMESWTTAGNRLPPIVDEKDQVEKRLELLRAQLALRTTLIGKVVDLQAKSQNPTASDSNSVEAQVQSAMEYVHEWSNRLLATQNGAATTAAVKVDIATLCDVGEAGQMLCRQALRMLAADQPKADTVQAIWTLATCSTKLYSSALSALDTASGSGAAAVLGQANTSTPTSRARCRILLALSTFSLFRASPIFEKSGVQGAIGTHGKLVDNARLYARKAVTEIGLGSLLRPLGSGAVRASLSPPPPGGWDSLTLEAESLFVLLRSLLYRYKVAIATNNTATPSLEQEVSSTLSHLVQLQRSPIGGDASLDLARWLYQKGLTTFVDQLIEENGARVCQEEVTWWQEVFTQLAVDTQQI